MSNPVIKIATAICAILSLTSCGDDRFPDYSYKMTVHAKGQQFSTVRHVEVTEGASIVDSGGSSVGRRITGEAVIIDLNERTFYALLSRPDNADYAKFVAGMALSPHIAKPAAKSDAEQAMADYEERTGPQDSFGEVAEGLQAMVQVKGARDLPRTLPPRNGRPPMQAWPMFVTFGDPDDPKTVRKVSPQSLGVERITIEITDEDPTTGISDILPSFGKESGFDRWYGTLSYDDPRRITKDAFITGNPT